MCALSGERPRPEELYDAKGWTRRLGPNYIVKKPLTEGILTMTLASGGCLASATLPLKRSWGMIGRLGGAMGLEPNAVRVLSGAEASDAFFWGLDRERENLLKEERRAGKDTGYDRDLHLIAASIYDSKEFFTCDGWWSKSPFFLIAEGDGFSGMPFLAKDFIISDSIDRRRYIVSLSDIPRDERPDMALLLEARSRFRRLAFEGDQPTLVGVPFDPQSLLYPRR